MKPCRQFLVPLLLLLLTATPALAQTSSRRQAELDNVQFIRGLYAAWTAGEYETMLDAMEEEVRWSESRTLPYGGNARGVEAVRDGVLLRLQEDFGGLVIALDEVLANGNQVVAHGTVSGFHAGTGRAVWSPYAGIWTLRDGKVRSYSGFVDADAFVRAYGE